MGRTKFSTEQALPTGVLMPYGGLVAPSGWLLCFGQLVSRTTYAALFAAIGINYGSGDGSTTFGIPDARGRTFAGGDAMGGTAANRLTSQTGGVAGTVGSVGGEQVHTLTRANMPNISGSLSFHGSGSATVLAGVGGGGDFTTVGSRTSYRSGGADLAGANSADTVSINVGSGGAHNNIQPTIVASYIIKI